jgi:hypothetical protein
VDGVFGRKRRPELEPYAPAAPDTEPAVEPPADAS